MVMRRLSPSELKVLVFFDSYWFRDRIVSSEIIFLVMYQKN
ncbi:MAG: hypothetical protein O4860_14745 [Trichodesmium sp. St2_bin2_1]|nr:hypothetical protein [Trichodesmium sp. St2_bin2_1]